MDIRYQPKQPLRIKLLHSLDSLNGRIVKLVGRVALIGVNRPVAFGAQIRIDFDDMILVGEVSACESGPEEHLLTLQVQEVVPMLSDLGRLVSAVMAGGRSVAPQDRSYMNNSANA